MKKAEKKIMGKIEVSTGNKKTKLHPDFSMMTDAEKAAKKAANEKRLATMRENLNKLESTAEKLLAIPEKTHAERLALLALVNVAYHDSGKIEGCFSVDSCASCDFCRRMISAATCNPLMICGACYAARDAYKEASWRRHTLNARILSSELFTVDELKALDKLAAADVTRYNEDGDTVNVIHARNLLRIAAAFPAMHVGYWYKNAPAVESGLHAEGYHTREQLPGNIHFIHSSALIGFPARALWFDDAIFTVYPDAETTAAAIADGAHECNGRRCRACGYTCYMMKRRAEPLHIAEYLRCGKAERDNILAAYHAKKAQRAAI